MTNAKKKYRKEKVKSLLFELYPTDEDIIKHFQNLREQGQPIVSYIKRIIREDMENKKIKEFAEIVKDKFFEQTDEIKRYDYDFRDTIDELIKNME